MRKTESKKNKLTREIPMSLKAIDEDKRQVELSFSSEKPYTRWFGEEILSHKDGAVDLTRLNEIGCLLFNHDRSEVIGRIDKAWIENGRGKAIVTFDEDNDSEIIYQKVKSGTLKAVSVGYKVDVWEEVSAGKFSTDGHLGPCSVATKWLPYEISIVSVPADDSVGVGRSAKETTKKEISIDFFEKQLQVNKNYIGGM